MKWLVISILFLSGCTREITSRDRIERYCKKCGGLKHSALSDTAAVIECIDGHQIIIKDATELILGECK